MSRPRPTTDMVATTIERLVAEHGDMTRAAIKRRLSAAQRERLPEAMLLLIRAGRMSKTGNTYHLPRLHLHPPLTTQPSPRK